MEIQVSFIIAELQTGETGVRDLCLGFGGEIVFAQLGRVVIKILIVSVKRVDVPVDVIIDNIVIGIDGVDLGRGRGLIHETAAIQIHAAESALSLGGIINKIQL